MTSGGRVMNRFISVVVAVGLFVATGTAVRATWEFRFSVAGLASNMPAETYDWGMRDVHLGTSGFGSGAAKTTDVEVTRITDSFSSSIMTAVTLGTPYPSATITL